MELENTKEVKEYLSINERLNQKHELMSIDPNDITLEIYRKYLYQIQENETNGIFVYLGTYRINDEIDIVHPTRDYRVDYNSTDADYRLYGDIECSDNKIVPIKYCSQFEKENIILNPKSYFKIKEYYNIQEEYFKEVVTTNQSVAKEKILKKYQRLHNKTK